MLKLLIVDDESLERQAVRFIVEKYKPIYQIIGEAANGEQAVEMAFLKKPDVILLDIKMPGIDGLQAAKKIKDILPGVKIILISAYGEFNYAQNAVQLGISEYLLKPVDTEKLVKTLGKLEAEVRKEEKKRQEEIKLKETLEDAMPALRMGFIMDLINGSEGDETAIMTRANFLGIQHLPEIAMHVWVDHARNYDGTEYEVERQILHKQIGDLIENILSEWQDALLATVGMGQFVILLPGHRYETHTSFSEEVQKLGDKICTRIREHTIATVTVGIGRPERNINRLVKSHTEALSAGEFRVLYGGDQSIYVDDVISIAGNNFFMDSYSSKEFSNAIRVCDFQKVIKEFDDFWRALSKHQDSYSASFRIELTAVIAIASRAAIEGGLDDEVVARSSLEIGREIIKVRPIGQIRDLLLNWLRDLIVKIKKAQEFRNTRLIDKAVIYVNRNYASDIGLDEVSKSVFLSSCYFSRLFKQVKGKSFSEYLTQVRLDKAKKLLLETEEKVSEVALRVGYKDARYFSQVFKKNEGMTPGNFRRNMVK